MSDLKLTIDASSAKRGAREFTGAIASIKAALAGMERTADGAFATLRKGMQVTPAKGAAKPINQTADAVKRLQATAKNALTTAGGDTAKLVTQFQQLGDTTGIRKAEQALEQYSRRLKNASSSADIGLAKADFRATVAGLNAEAKAQQNAAASAAKRATEMVALRRRHDEMFAVSKRYEASLEEIAELERTGAISASKAANARARAAQQLAAGAVATGKYGQALKVNQFHVSNFNNVIDDMSGKARRFDMRQVAMQMSQAGQQGAVTGNYLQALMIQLPDLALGFGPVGIAAGAVAGVLGTTLVGAMSKTSEESDKMKNQVHELSTALDGLEENSTASAAQIEAHLKKAFGSVAGDVQALIEDLREAEFAVLSHKMQREVEKATTSLNSLGGAFEIFWADFANPGSVDSGYLKQMTEIITKSKMSYGEFQKLDEAVKQVFTAKDVNSFVEHLSRARGIAEEIGGPVGKQIGEALLQAAKDGGVLHRVTSDAASGATDLATELSDGAKQVLELNKIDMSQGLSDATKQAAELAHNLGISLTAAINLKNLQDSKVYSGRGGVPRKFENTPPVVTIPTRTTGGAPKMDDLTRVQRQIEATSIALKAQAEGLFETSQIANLYAEMMVKTGGDVDAATLAILKQKDAAVSANEQLRKIVQTNQSGGLQEATEQGLKSGLRSGLQAAMQGDVGGFAQSLADSVYNSLSNAIADALTEQLFAKNAASAGSGILGFVGSIFGFDEGVANTSNPGAWQKVPQFAEGTPNTSGGMPAILHPNEAVVPLSRGRNIPVEMKGGAGGIRDVNINTSVTVEGGDDSPENAERIARYISEEIDGRIRLTLAEEMAYGGMANPRGGM